MQDKAALFICNCGTNIRNVIDIDYIINHFSKDKNLSCVNVDHLCTEEGLTKIRETIESEDVKKVVIAACSPKLHGELFKQNLEKAGVNRGFLQIANIREGCSWVHWDQKEKATLKALSLIKMALAALRDAEEIRKVEIDVVQRILIIGGGIAGITAALNLAKKGYEVIIVEKEGFIGGHMAKWDKMFPTLDCSICIEGPLMSELYNYPNVKIYTLSEVTEVSGSPGRYLVKITRKPRYVDEKKCNGCDRCIEICPMEVPNEFNYGIGRRKAMVKPYPETVPLAPYIDMENCVGCRSCEGVCDLEAINFNDERERITEVVGAIIVATGFKPFNPEGIEEYGYGRIRNVITAPELERILNPSGPTLGRLVRPSDGGQPRRICFVQCVGSRSMNLGKPYCSRVCCMYAIKEAMQVKEIDESIEVVIFYTDIRAFGKGFEEMYDKAAKEYNISFIRGRVAEIFEDKETGNVTVRVEDTLLGEMLELEFDLVVLSVGLDYNPDNELLSTILRIPLDENGFYLERHPKLHPSDTFVKGIFLAGTCQGPKDIADTVAHAGLAATKAMSFLSEPKLELELISPRIDQSKCMFCLLCSRACDSNAIKFELDRVIIDETACQGCGACAAMCPSGALIYPSQKDEQILAMIDAATEEPVERPLIISFLCNWCGYAAADRAGVFRMKYPTAIKSIWIPCTARLSAQIILKAFEKGVDGVLIIGCHENDCHYRVGFAKERVRIKKVRELMEALGINKERLLLESASASEAERIVKIMRGFVDKIIELGPLVKDLEVTARE